jgi:putative transposase
MNVKARSGAEVAAEMAASGALDEIFAKIDTGELDLTG